jgi:hypothetical protein
MNPKLYDRNACPCGSGLYSEWQYDGRGIELCRTCAQCHAKKMSRYNPVILKPYTQADVDEQIEEDY